MDEIIENKLWLGNYSSALGTQILKEKGINKVITVTDFSEGIKYDENINHKKFSIDDSPKENIIQYFDDCLNFIKEEGKILVHCMAGVSRSASIVIAYLMWTKKLEFEQALAEVREKRPLVGPNIGFEKQLQMFEKLLKENNYEIEKIKFKDIKWEPTEENLKEWGWWF